MTFRDKINDYRPINDQERNDKSIILNYIDKFDDTVLTRNNEVAHMTSSGLILNNDLSKILMIHHKIYDTWTWTGGHADGEDDMLLVALTEAREETGLVDIRAQRDEIASVDILPVWGHYKNGVYVSAHLHLNTSFVLIADESDELFTNHDETHGVKWINVSDISKWSNEPYIIEVYNKIITGARAYKSSGKRG